MEIENIKNFVEEGKLRNGWIVNFQGCKFADNKFEISGADFSDLKNQCFQLLD